MSVSVTCKYTINAAGQMTPAQLLVKGAITHVQDSTAGGHGGVNGGALVVHGAGAVDEDAERDGEVLVAEAGDGLGYVVLEDVEGVIAEGLHAATGAVEDGGVEADLVGVFAEGECAA